MALGVLLEKHRHTGGALDDDDEAFADGVLKLKQRFRHILRSYLEARLDAVRRKGQRHLVMASPMHASNAFRYVRVAKLP
jgi:hypothetical protein